MHAALQLRAPWRGPSAPAGVEKGRGMREEGRKELNRRLRPWLWLRVRARVPWCTLSAGIRLDTTAAPVVWYHDCMVALDAGFRSRLHASAQGQGTPHRRPLWVRPRNARGCGCRCKLELPAWLDAPPGDQMAETCNARPVLPNEGTTLKLQ